jgi:hypothetical protein
MVKTLSTKKMTEQDWKTVHSCCGQVEKWEWAKGRFLYRCSKCQYTRAMESNGMITMRKVGF